MKYRVDLKKVEYVPATVFAASPEEAIAVAVAGSPGFKAEAITELLDQDEEGKYLSVDGSCEACHRALFNSQYIVSCHEDCAGLLFCFKCYDEMVRTEVILPTGESQ